MARRLFGSIADYVVAPGGAVTSPIAGNETILVPGKTLTFWNGASGGSQYTDLLDLSLTPISSVVTDASGAIPQFWGPDGVSLLYGDAGGSRRAMIPVDLGVNVDSNTTAIAAVQAILAGLASVATSGQYNDLSGKPALATVAITGQFSDLSGAPPAGLQAIYKLGGTWPVRASTAPDTSRPAMWIGAAPGPAFGGSYAITGDLWMATVA